MIYLFDVDGTLTPPREKMSIDFSDFFSDWIVDKEVYLVTGSDKDKTIEQIGLDLWKSVSGVWQSCGNEYWVTGELQRRSEWVPPLNLIRLLGQIIEASEWPECYGNHIEVRTGMVNFSICGRNATQLQRSEYEEWDNEHKERKKYVDLIKSIHRYHLDASIGGQISIDIYPLDDDKSQVVDVLDGTVHFFGDKCQKGGNDFTLAQKLKSISGNKVQNVKGPEHTMKLLKKI